MSLQISIRESGDVTILDLRGRSTIDGESERLSDSLKKLVAKGVRKFLLNLTDDEAQALASFRPQGYAAAS
jgi:hypothetical protein